MAFTTQQTFDMVVEHLITQGRPSRKTDETGIGCLYRYELNGKMLKCAIGALIPDDLYDVSMENVTFFGLKKGEKVAEFLLNMHPGLYEEKRISECGKAMMLGSHLQDIHDNARQLSDSTFDFSWLKLQMGGLAVVYGLNLDKMERLLLEK